MTAELAFPYIATPPLSLGWGKCGPTYLSLASGLRGFEFKKSRIQEQPFGSLHCQRLRRTRELFIQNWPVADDEECLNTLEAKASK